MELVVDTNVLVSFFRESPVRRIIVNPGLIDLSLHVPEHCFAELSGITPALSRYSGLAQGKVASAISELRSLVRVHQPESLEPFAEEARRLAPHDKDVPVFALALRLGCPIWSNEPAFRRQPKVRVLGTRELTGMLGMGPDAA